MSWVSAQRASAPRFLLRFCHILAVKFSLKYLVDRVCNVMAHAQKPDFVFRRNGRVHLNSWGRQFSRLLAAEVCASAVVMLDTPSSDVVKGTGYPLHSPVSPSLPLPCVTVCHHVSTGIHCTGGWAGPRGGLDGYGKSPPPGFIPVTVKHVASRNTD